MAVKRAQEGYTYQQERGFDVAEKASQNEAVGQYTNVGIGLGTMAAMGSSIGSVVGNAAGKAFNSIKHPVENAVIHCVSCGAVLPANSKFCMECGTAQSRKCPNCGTEVPIGGKFCLECGLKFKKKGIYVIFKVRCAAAVWRLKRENLWLCANIVVQSRLCRDWMMNGVQICMTVQIIIADIMILTKPPESMNKL